MRKILVMEDEDNIRAFVVLNLKRVGYDVVDVASGEAALEAFAQAGGDFDIAILDIMLPGIDGFEVCRRIREQSSSIGIIMLSAKSQEMDKVQGLMLGADDYITKPFSPSELLARVDAIYRRVSLSGGGKGIGIEKMLAYYGLDKAEALAFGDGNNDREMLQAVGTGVAMENGSPELKALADEICGPVYEDGIYHYCADKGLI